MNPSLISIGKLAKATGFSVERLRIWELRYGAPLGERLPSGHRRYSAEEVERLHLVRECIARGKRPRHIVALSREELLMQLESPLGGQAAPPPRLAHAALPWSTKAWVSAARRLDEAYLDRQFYEHWLDLGSLRFLRERAEPFIHALGEEWQKGEICVAEEHFGSEKMGDFLAGIWRRLNARNEARPILLTTLPGETHRLGLQMAAVVGALAGMKVVYLGPSTPLEEAAAMAEKVGAKGLFFSLALGTDQAKAAAALQQLRQRLPLPMVLGVGGAGAPLTGDKDEVPWTSFGSLDAFYAWARAWKDGTYETSTARHGKMSPTASPSQRP